ncbi:MAG: response regulator [Chloroflexota bacterium]|nr:response regulator [Chloroflexota bacterium]
MTKNPEYDPAMTNHQSPLVLVADDHPNTTVLMQYVFEREGFRVEQAADGVTALQIAREQRPDLILLDIMMPLMNGFEVLRRLREDPLTAKIPTVIITANAKEPGDIAKGLNLGADDFLLKPIQPTELVARVMSKMKARRLEDALERRGQELEALLQASETLNQHLALEELLDEIVVLLRQLLPADVVVLHYLDQHGMSLEYRLSGEIDEIIRAQLIHPQTPQANLNAKIPVVRLAAPIIGGQFADGIGAVLRQGETLVGIVYLLTHTTPYDDNHIRIFTGIARQAALALNNARLFAVQTEYALHLEDMVNERTQELQSAQRMVVRNEKLTSLGFIAASIAHEIGNSMQPIKVLFDDFAEEIERANIPIDRRGLEIIDENIDRIYHTIELIRDFASDRPNAADLLPLDIGQIVEGILELNHKLLQYSNIVVETDLPNLPLVHGSRTQLQSVFMNLILNSVAAMTPNGGVMRVTAQRTADMIEVHIADTGHGIPPENIGRIFDPFFTTKPNGTGLGLSVSFGIIKSHQGVIEARSENQQGATFVVRLPIHSEG